jgi:hypothetical protein
MAMTSKLTQYDKDGTVAGKNEESLVIAPDKLGIEITDLIADFGVVDGDVFDLSRLLESLQPAAVTDSFGVGAEAGSLPIADEELTDGMTEVAVLPGIYDSISILYSDDETSLNTI